MTQTNSSVVTSLKLWEVELAKSFPRNNTRKRSERDLTWGQPEPSLLSATYIWNCAKFFTVSYIPVKSSESSAYYEGIPFHLGIKSIEKTGIRVYNAGGNKIEKLPPPLSVHNTGREIGKFRIKLTRLREWMHRDSGSSFLNLDAIQFCFVPLSIQFETSQLHSLPEFAISFSMS